MAKWEYMKMNRRDDVDREIRDLNALGEDDWELIGTISPVAFVLKRQIKCKKCDR